VADNLRPLTLLLAAFALWALSVLVLAMSGLGSRFPTAAKVGEPPPLPRVSLTRSLSRLGPISDYLEVGQRPLLTQDRRPAPVLAADGQPGSGDLDVTLTSVLITPRLQMAIFTDNKDASSRRVKVGDTIEGSNWRLVQLQARGAVIEGPSGQRSLDLRVFDGKGGQAPTPSVAISSGPPGNDGADQGVPPSPVLTPPVQQLPRPPPVTQSNASVKPPDQSATGQLTQEQQVEAIRRRIEARRAQMRAEAAAGGSNDK
jgi:general secretion pathway protein N